MIAARLLRRQVHFLQERLVARILLQCSKPPVTFDILKTIVFLCVRPFEPMERRICFTSNSVNRCDCERSLSRHVAFCAAERRIGVGFTP
jgi:hypothetical protein